MWDEFLILLLVVFGAGVLGLLVMGIVEWHLVVAPWQLNGHGQTGVGDPARGGRPAIKESRVTCAGLDKLSGAYTTRRSSEMSCEQRVHSMTAESAADFSTFGSRSPVAAHLRISEAMSALAVDVRLASGSIAVISSKTDFINSISSG